MLERRLDKALDLRVAGERRLLHVEIELDHRKIYKAVAAQDEVAARRLMDEHLGFLRANYQPGINSTEGFDQPKQRKRR